MIYRRGSFTANPDQSQAITHPPAPLIILAGAGTGKTTTLLHRIIYLIEEYHTDPAQILAITYTDRAAQELKSRVIDNVGPRAEAITVATFHALCYAIVREYEQTNSNAPTLMEEGDAIFLLLNRFDDLQPFASRAFPENPVKAVIGSFLPFFNRLRDELITPAEHPLPEADNDQYPPEKIAQLQDLLRIFPRFQAWKQAEDRVDYGDMILRCYELLTADQAFRNRLQQRYRHILVDEFQDNNYALNEVLNLLSSPPISITVVGDDDQVVYGFRGASAVNIVDFEQRYGNQPDYRTIALTVNYRSHQRILDVANAVIRHNSLRKEKNLKAVEGKQSGPYPELWWGDSPAQHRFLPEKIKELVNTENYGYADIAVLCRTRSQVRRVARYLQREHIPTQVYLTEYFQIPAIRDLLGWCQVVGEGEHQEAGLYRVLARFRCEGVAHAWFSRFRKRDEQPRLELIWEDPELDTDPELKALLELIRQLQVDAVKKTAGEMVWEIAVKTGLFRPLMHRYEWEDQVAIMNLGDLLTRAQEFTRRHPEHPQLHDFVRYMVTLQQAGTVQTLYPTPVHTKPAVLIQTIHGVKGAQFPVVFIPYNRTGSFPLNFRAPQMVDHPPESWLRYTLPGNPDPRTLHLEEERRLFYVAVTRAEERLFLLAPKRATSPFIKEIPLTLVKEHVMNSPQPVQQPPRYADLRNRYEQRLINALASNQFRKVREITNVIERLQALETGKPVTWGSEPWEQELRAQLQPPLRREEPRPLDLSASTIETYLECPLKYRLGNIDRVPETASKPQLTFGLIIHRVLEQFHDPDGAATKERLLQLLETNWDPEGFDYAAREAEFKKQGVELLERYYDYIQEHPPTIAEREFKFSFKVDGITISGKIDRIDRGEHGYRVIDYKTSRNRMPAKKSLQLAIYCLYLYLNQNDRFGGLPEAATLFFLRQENDPEETHRFTPEELQETRHQITVIRDGILNQEYDPKPGFHCDWCDYKQLLCPAWED
jgi:DNA helicase-2/ATP-dependent DNA helicase PcrA